MIGIGAQGWIYDPWAVAQVMATLPNPVLSRTAYAGPLLATEHRDTMFWELERLVLGRVLPAHFQKRGTCVSQGYARATQHLIQAEILAGEPEEWRARVLQAGYYGFSRVEVGGGRIGGDGSVGAWAAKAAKDYGVLLKVKTEKYDLTGEDDDLYCVEWGRNGVPNDLEPMAKLHCVMDVSQVTDAEMGAGCIYNFKPVPVCSNQGFATTRDRYGMCGPQGTWAHCMETAGVLKIKHPQYPGGRLVAAIWQSWGNDNPSGNDKVILESGQEITLPPGVFLIDFGVWDRMLAAGDSFALAGMQGWKATRDDFLFLAG